MTRGTTTTIVLLFFAALGVLCGNAFGQDRSSEAEWTERLALRYDAAGWPGKAGPVVAGLELDEGLLEKNGLSTDHRIWLAEGDERILLRYFSAPLKRLSAGVGVARSCAAAQKILFGHLARPRAIEPIATPVLPYGEIRMEGLGDVCFVVPLGDGAGFHSIEFVRHNVVILLRAFDRKTAKGLKDLAIALDDAIIARPLHKDWLSSNEWPEIVRFDTPRTSVEANSIVPLAVSLSSRFSSGAPLSIDWEMTAGGIIQDGGAFRYHAEGEGAERLILLVADERGLARSAGIEFVIAK